MGLATFDDLIAQGAAKFEGDHRACSIPAISGLFTRHTPLAGGKETSRHSTKGLGVVGVTAG
jgi:hypothetical protein